MEEKVSYQVGVNIIGINDYVEHFIPVEDVKEGEGETEIIEDDDTDTETVEE